MYNNYKKDSYYRAKKLVTPYIKENKIDKRRTSLKWADFVDSSLAANSLIYDITAGTLVIETNHNVYKNKILFMQRQILKKINEAYPILKLQTIKVVVKDNLMLIQ
ncbi:MAG: DUF721 domain-containing protein [Spirochaetaceae bacterium]|nr:DUF721 domain-containing protein [Spirochaetaceae bacterium]